MAVSNVAVLSNLALFIDTDNQSTAVAVKTSSAVIYAIEIDNTANAAASFTKLWNVAQGSVTVGTTAPDAIIMVPASTSRTAILGAGITFDTATTVATVTTAGTAGTTNPTSSVIVRITYV